MEFIYKSGACVPDTFKVEPDCLVPILNPNSIKQMKNACLLFDKVTPLFHTTRSRARRARFPLSIAYFPDEQTKALVQRELEWLHEIGILDCPDSDPLYPDGLEDFRQDIPVWIYRNYKDNYKAWQNDKEEFDSDDIKHINIPIFQHDLAIVNGTYNSITDEKKKQVLEILIKHFPILREDTPWEEVIEWRCNEEAQIKLRRLKHWSNSIAQQTEINLNKLEEEVLCLLDDYENYMKIMKMKYSYSVVRSIATTTGELLENIAKLKFKNLLETPFAFNKRNILLKESELSAPGRELAYIIATKEHFE